MKLYPCLAAVVGFALTPGATAHGRFATAHVTASRFISNLLFVSSPL